MNLGNWLGNFGIFLMRLTTRGRYAVTALLDLAVQESRHQGAISLSDIAKRQSISISYLNNFFPNSEKKGWLVALEGLRGVIIWQNH